MDELAKKLSIISFGVIGVICLIGVLQSRSWLDMFTIGGTLLSASWPIADIGVYSIPCGGGNSGGVADSNDRNACTGCFEDGQAESDCQKIALRGGARKRVRYLFGQDRYEKLHFFVNISVDTSSGTLTMNEQTVTEAYAVDEIVHLDPPPAALTAAIRKTLDVGALCNNASMARNEEGIFVGQSTDVALLNILHVVGLPDRRTVRHIPLIETPPHQLWIDFQAFIRAPFQFGAKVHVRQRHSH